LWLKGEGAFDPTTMCLYAYGYFFNNLLGYSFSRG
jgi:hypothetical protein